MIESVIVVPWGLIKRISDEDYNHKRKLFEIKAVEVMSAARDIT